MAGLERRDVPRKKEKKYWIFLPTFIYCCPTSTPPSPQQYAFTHQSIGSFGSSLSVHVALSGSATSIPNLFAVRIRLNGYHVHCGYERRAGGCPSSPDMCRSAMLGIMGTILTTNCTCQLADEYDNTKCMQAKERLQNDNICKGERI